MVITTNPTKATTTNPTKAITPNPTKAIIANQTSQQTDSATFFAAGSGTREGNPSGGKRRRYEG
jgi:hypothetical protein